MELPEKSRGPSGSALQPSGPAAEQLPAPKAQQLRLVIATWIVVLIGLDQLTKELARLYLQGTGAHEYVGMWVFQYAENSGAFLSLGAGLSESMRFWLLQVGVLLFLIYAARKLYLETNLNVWARWAWLLMAAGGFGNWIDRAWAGRVTDFMIFHFPALSESLRGLSGVSTGIFNVADMYIVVAFFFFVFENQLVKFSAARGTTQTISS